MQSQKPSSKRRRIGWRAAWSAMAFAVFIEPASGASVEDLRRLSIEQLAQLEVTSVSKRPEALRSAAASLFVITDDSIRSAAPTTLAEALRLAPNLHVARFDTLGYVVAARGFNGYQQANKLLVLLDGRTVYTPLQSGVFWDAQNILLHDVEKIEVVSGPGGTLWGTNAVNGVVNVTTKSAYETQGNFVSGTIGTDEKQVALRHGGRLGQVAYRFYAMGFDRERPAFVSGRDTGDDWTGGQAGIRLDWAGVKDTVTLQGDVYRYEADLDVGRANMVDFHLEGGNLLGRWERQLGSASAVEVQAYVDKADRNALSGLQDVETADIEARHITEFGRHHLVWGGGYRLIYDDYQNLINAFQLDPRRRRLRLGNIFFQDEIALRPELRLTIGARLEKSSFTGSEFLPSARLAWQPSGVSTLWAAVSRAARAPNRIERELVAPGILVKGGFRAERVVAFEVGYRGRPWHGTSLSVSTYYNVYDGIRGTEPVAPGPLPLRFVNAIDGNSYGIEVWGDVDLRSWWRFSFGLTAMDKQFELKPGRADITNLNSVGNDPDYQVQLRSQVDLSPDAWLDVRFRAVDALPRPEVPAYGALDVTLGWHPLPGLELALRGVNLLDRRHAETAEPPARREFRRSVSLSARWEF